MSNFTKNSIEQTIFNLIELSKCSKVPVLMASNPGYGKTTIINKYARLNNYHVETLIGSRFSPEDIMGYQVNNGGSHLEHLNPTWYERIMEAHNNNQATILFIDELSTCNDSVQGSLLDLIFSRTTGDNRKLPDDCFIIAAANYKDNLPSFMNIMAPTINRFCIINLLDNKTNIDIIDEFLKTPKDAKIFVPSPLSEECAEKINSDYYELIKKILVKYSGTDSSLGLIDLKNTNLEGVYSRSGPILNFMSGRSVYYLKQMIKSIIACGIPFNDGIVPLITDGLIGLGSNSFKTEEQIKAFRELVAKEVSNLIRNISNSTIVEEKIDLSNITVADAVVKAIAAEQDKTTLDNNYISAVVNKIVNKYENTVETFNKLSSSDNTEKLQFISDMEGISVFIKIIKDDEDARLIAGIHQSLLGLYNDLLGTSSTIEDYKTAYGLFTPKSVKGISILKLKDGTVTKAGYVGSGTSKTYTRMAEVQNPIKTTLSKIIASNLVDTELHLAKIV